jgi:hypothetical protein
MRWIFFCIFSVFFVSTLFAIDLEKQCRVPNQEPGYCAWASIETLGRKHQIESLINLVEKRKLDSDFVFTKTTATGEEVVTRPKHVGCDRSIEAKLKELGVKYQFQNTGNKDFKILELNGTRLGCMVGVQKGARGPAAHCIVVTKFNDKEVEFYDCNQPKTLWTGSREWFDYHWTGLAVVVEK